MIILVPVKEFFEMRKDGWSIVSGYGFVRYWVETICYLKMEKEFISISGSYPNENIIN